MVRNSLKIAFGCDHAGFDVCTYLVEYAQKSGYQIINCGTYTTDSTDYPDYAQAVVNTILEQQANYGVLVCGTGIGMSIAANRFKNIRAALCHDQSDAILARQHNNANILCLRGRNIDNKTAIKCFNAFLNTDFENGRHQIRLDKVD